MGEYNKPAYNAVNFALTTYTKPAHNVVDLNLGGTTSSKYLKYYNGAAWVNGTTLKVRGASSWITPIAVKVYNGSTWETITIN